MNETQLLINFQAAYAADASAIAQNKAWCDLTDSNGRLMDKFTATDSVSLAVALRTREINRNFMYSKIYATADAEMGHTLNLDTYFSAVQFKAFVYSTVAGAALRNVPVVTCAALQPVLVTDMLGNPTAPINAVLLGIQSKKTIVGQIRPNLANFAALYTRKLQLLASGNPLQAISADIVAELKTHFIEKVNRKVHKWAELVACFGDANLTAQGSIRRNVIKRIYDLAADYFDRATESDYVVNVNVTSDTTVTPAYYEFSVTLNITGPNGTKIGDRLVLFLRGFIEAYSHPQSIVVVRSAASSSVGVTNGWIATLRAFAAADNAYDPRDLTGDRPDVPIPPTTPDNATEPEYRNTLDNFNNVRPQDYNTAVASIDTSLNAQMTARASAETQLTAATSTYNALPSFDFSGSSGVNADIQAFANATFDLTKLRLWAANGAAQVKRAHMQLVAKVKADLADQVVAARNCEILSINLRLQVIRLVAELNGTGRSSCSLTIPDWRQDNFSQNDCYPLTRDPNCTAIANILLQLNLLKQRMLTAVSVKTAVNAKVTALTASVGALETRINAYAQAIQTTYAARKTSTELKAVVAAADFKARVAACVRTMTNGILSSCSYDYLYSNTNANIATHTVNAQFDASAHVGVTTAMVRDRLRAGLQLCLSMHIGGDLSYFKAAATGSVSGAKRSSEQTNSATSSVDSDFSDTTTTSGSQGTTGGQQTGTTSMPITTTGAGAITFSVISLIALLLVALF
jgi:hypothetical protein